VTPVDLVPGLAGGDTIHESAEIADALSDR
jgi:hypothetical protein